jgi:hypothetical protein
MRRGDQKPVSASKGEEENGYSLGTFLGISHMRYTMALSLKPAR